MFGLVGVESSIPALVSDAVPISAGWSGCGACALDQNENTEFEEGMVCPEDWCELVNSDVVKGGENRPQEVSGHVGR